MRTRAGFVGGLIIALSGCAQFTTSGTERSQLETTATSAGQAYVDCVVESSGRYQQSGADAGSIVEAAKKACSSARSSYVAAETAYLDTRYMRTEPILNKELAALDDQAKARVSEQVLERSVAAPPAAAPVAKPAAAPADDNKYLDCMRAQGERYASVNEPAEVIAEVAQSRCSAALTDSASAAQLERQGRALVMGMVLDRKVGQ